MNTDDCPNCGGNGVTPTPGWFGTPWEYKCATCHGTGQIPHQHGWWPAGGHNSETVWRCGCGVDGVDAGPLEDAIVPRDGVRGMNETDFPCCENGEHTDPKPWLNPTTGERRVYSVWEGFVYAPRPKDWSLPSREWRG